MKDLYINFGCGLSTNESFINYDSSPSLLIRRAPILNFLFRKQSVEFPKTVKCGNIVKGLPHTTGSVKGIYSAHVLEHLVFEDCQIALKNSYDYLESGGSFSCVLHNFESSVRNYLKEKDAGNRNACNEFLTYSFLGQKTRKRSIVGFIIEFYSGTNHLWMWDFEYLSEQLKIAGFKEVKRSYFNASEDRTFDLIENKSRYDYEALCIEARK